MDFVLTYVASDEDGGAIMVDDNDEEDEEVAVEEEPAGDNNEETIEKVGFFGSIRNLALAAAGRVAFAYIPFAGAWWMASYLIQMWVAA